MNITLEQVLTYCEQQPHCGECRMCVRKHPWYDRQCLCQCDPESWDLDAIAAVLNDEPLPEEYIE